MRHRPPPGQYHPAHYALSLVGLGLIAAMAWLAVHRQLKAPFVVGGGDREDWVVPEKIIVGDEAIVPLCAGRKIAWRLIS